MTEIQAVNINARYTKEVAEELMEKHGIDVEKEILQALKSELTKSEIETIEQCSQEGKSQDTAS